MTEHDLSLPQMVKLLEWWHEHGRKLWRVSPDYWIGIYAPDKDSSFNRQLEGTCAIGVMMNCYSDSQQIAQTPTPKP